jgi:N-acetyl-gamma-glutamyl-phosphate reductase
MHKTRVGIIGATGYVGVELVRGLSVHPNVELTCLVSRSFSGKAFSDIYPAYKGICDTILSDCSPSEMASFCDVVITALPHGVSSQVVPVLLDAGVKVIDHSGDFRYRNAATYEFSYGLSHPRPDLLAEAVYGIPELYREELTTARLTANPGCYPTCSILALAPLLRHGLIKTDGIIIDAISAISGAGRKADLPYSFCEACDSLKPYAVLNHRHTTEIEQECSLAAGKDIHVSFTPHLAPMKRGMLATIYADPIGECTSEELRALYQNEYSGDTFVRILPGGTLPDTANVIGSNYIDIAVEFDRRTGKIKLFSALDNLGKGAALQAIQALNVMQGYPEDISLRNLSRGI